MSGASHASYGRGGEGRTMEFCRVSSAMTAGIMDYLEFSLKLLDITTHFNLEKIEGSEAQLKM